MCTIGCIWAGVIAGSYRLLALQPKLSVLITPGTPARTAPQGKLWALAPLPAPDDFDRLLTAEARRVSTVHWTPSLVCQRTAHLLALKPTQRVLDVGSGVGKLCVLASLAGDGQYVGVEQREALVDQARTLASSLGSTAEFIAGDALSISWSGFDALYFYNPFDEVRFPASNRIDASLRTGPAEFQRLVAQTQARLEALQPGTRVVTFHGIGGPMPGCYSLIHAERIADGELEVWTRGPLA